MITMMPTYEFRFGHGLASPVGEVVRIAYSPGGPVCKTFSYRFDDLLFVKATGVSMPADLADLLDIAAAVLISDRLAPRSAAKGRSHEDGLPSRRIVVNLAVRDPDRWTDPCVRSALERLLSYLSQDEFSFRFGQRSRSAPRRSEIQALLPWSQCDDEPRGVLHSGGLDSYLGLVRATSEQPQRPIGAASVASSQRVRRVQGRIVEGLRSYVGYQGQSASDILWPVMVLGLARGSRSRDDRESSQRTRGFLYLVAGVVGVALAGGRELWVAENGIGAIGLSYTVDQVGAETTRATHPRTLAFFGNLLRVSLDRPLRVLNPFLWTTKSDMVRVLHSNDRLLELARQTVSCDRVPYLAPGEACGRCSSCLLTRQALITGGLAPVDQSECRRYIVDVLADEANGPPGALTPLYAMRVQAERLRLALTRAAPFDAMAQSFPELLDVLASADYLGLDRATIEGNLVDLYRAYLGQTDRFLALIQRPGWMHRAPITELAERAAWSA